MGSRVPTQKMINVMRYYRGHDIMNSEEAQGPVGNCPLQYVYKHEITNLMVYDIR